MTQYRCQPNADYDGYKDKDTLRKALVEEQRGLCCYCMSRIKVKTVTEVETVTIEHWYPQAQYRKDKTKGKDTTDHGDLDYDNLLAVCKGNEGADPRNQHCGTRKGDRCLKYNPAVQSHAVESRIEFSTNGDIYSSDKDFNDQLNSILNLHHARLKNQRKDTLKGFKQELGRRFPNGNASPIFLKKKLDEWSGISSSGELNPFCQVVVCWIQKRLERDGHLPT